MKMYYRNRDTGEVLFGGDVRKLHKKVSFRSDGGTFSDLGYDEIASTPPPAPSGTYKTVYRDGETQDANGDWAEAWAERDMTAEEVQQRDDNKAEQVRAERNEKLANSDWTQLADSPADKAAWATYRQALRDMTDQAGFPNKIDRPAEP
jgi:hypothetical protein